MITLVTTYFEDPHRLEFFIENNFNENFFSRLIIVDDGSPRQPAIDIVSDYPEKNISLFRVIEDIGFNSHGCRNLAMKHVDTEWAWLTDIDRDGIGTCAEIVSRYIDSHRHDEYYNFLLGTGKATEVTHNDYCIRTEDFWKSGGYDEEYVNMHMGDRIFIERLDSYLTPTNIPYIIKSTRAQRVCKFRDIGITVYPDDNTMLHPKIDQEKLKQIDDTVKYRNANPETWIRDNIINFNWEQII